MDARRMKIIGSILDYNFIRIKLVEADLLDCWTINDLYKTKSEINIWHEVYNGSEGVHILKDGNKATLSEYDFNFTKNV